MRHPRISRKRRFRLYAQSFYDKFNSEKSYTFNVLLTLLGKKRYYVKRN